MSAMRWFRKYNKRIMVIAGCILMVAFLLPAAFFRSGGKNPAEEVVAFFNDSQGEQVEITRGMLGTAENELKALEILNISYVNMLYVSQNAYLPGFTGIGSGPVFATDALLFSSKRTDPQTIERLRNYRDDLYRQVDSSDWANEEKTREQLKESIKQLTGAEAHNTIYYYLLLTYEARQMGIRPTTDTVDKLLELRQFRGMKIADILKQCRLRDTNQLRKAVANYVAIVRYCDLATKTLDISTPQLKKHIRDTVQKENVSGTYVTFHGYQLRNQFDKPTPEELREQFEQYKTCDPKIFTEENPHGFGYRLPDRVKIEFLMIDLAQTQKGIENKFAKQDVLKREKLIQSYWKQDKETYLSQYKSRKKNPENDSEGETSDDPQDERNARLEWEQKKVWQKRQALQAARDLIREAKERSKNKLSISELKQIPPDQRASHAIDYHELAKQLNKNWTPNDPNILCNPNYNGMYLSQNQLYRLGPLRKAELRPLKQPGRPVEDILFQCKPLQKGTLTRLDEAPTELYSDIGPLESGDPGKETAVYLVRIVGTDPAREPVSLYDDGSDGPVIGSLTPNENNPMSRQVKQDWKSRKGFMLAVEHANRFAKADPNWTDAIANVKNEHDRDPNLPNPLWENTMEESNTQVARLSQQIQFLKRAQKPTTTLSKQIEEIHRFQENVVELARKRQEQSPADLNRAVLPREDKLSCLVFKNLKLAPASQQEYLRRKPLNTQRSIWSRQEILTIIHLAPGNIEKRTGFERKTNQD